MKKVFSIFMPVLLLIALLPACSGSEPLRSLSGTKWQSEVIMETYSKVEFIDDKNCVYTAYMFGSEFVTLPYTYKVNASLTEVEFYVGSTYNSTGTIVGNVLNWDDTDYTRMK